LKNTQNETSSEEDRYLLNFDSLTVSLKNIVQYVQPNVNNITRNYNFNDTMVYQMLIQNQSIGVNDVTDVTNVQLYRDMFRSYNSSKKIWKTLDHIRISNFTIMPTNGNFVARSDSGILSMFNRLLQSYLTTFYDGSTKKIYQNLLTTLTNNSLANITESGTGFHDLGNAQVDAVAGDPANNVQQVDAVAAVTIPDFQTNVLPDNNVVISASLGFIIKTLFTRALNPTTPDAKFHLLTDLNAVSPHFLEVMKSNLPVYIQLFTNLVKKALFYRRILLDNDFVRAGRITNNNIASGDIVIDSDTIIKTIGLTENGNSIERTQRYRTILDNIVECATDIITDATNVLNELNVLDNNKVPMFMDIKKDFIRNYQNITKSMPFTPTSHVSTLLNINTPWNATLAQTQTDNQAVLIKRFNEVIPTNQFSTSSYNFKFQHGIKPLYSNHTISLENAPYMKELVKSYNSSLTSVNTIDDAKVNETLRLFTTLTRMNLFTILKSYETTASNVIFSEIIDSVNPTYQMNLDTRAVAPIPPAINQIMFTIQDTIVDNSKKVVSKYVSASTHVTVSGLDNRDSARILNIIDLNIVPINVHAMMREIPLINIYNYSYSLTSYLNKLGNGQLLLEFIKNPYKYNHCYDANVANINIAAVANAGADHNDEITLLTSAVNALNLDKPRFLQDQLFTKVLLRENEIADNVINGDVNDMRAGGPPAQLHANAQVAKTRYDTKLVRNLVFITQLQRILRVQIRNKLQTINTRVISDAKILSEQYTEFSGTHQTYDDNEFTYNN
jgi:hypothetical protein